MLGHMKRCSEVRSTLRPPKQLFHRNDPLSSLESLARPGKTNALVGPGGGSLGGVGGGGGFWRPRSKGVPFSGCIKG